MAAPEDDRLFDTHAHIFIDETARYPVDLRGAREGEESIRRRIAAHPIPPEQLLQWWDESGVAAGAGVQYNTVYKTDNRFLLDSADRYGTRLSPVVMLDAADPETPAMLDDMAARRGVTALRLSGWADANGAYPWLDSQAALRAWEAAGRARIGIVLMVLPRGVAPAFLGSVRALAERFPAIPITLDHCGWANGAPAQLAIAALASHSNVYFKATSITFSMLDAAGYDIARFVRQCADLFGADRLMWGSDVGNTQQTYAEMAERARAAAALLNVEERRAFLFGTGQRLFPPRAG